MDNIFEYRDWLDNHDKEDGSYRYYEQKYNARKNLLNLFWTPFFEEIKRNTEGIQKVLKESGYGNIDWLLKALIIDWIKFFLHLDYQIRIDDDIHYDDYFLWLFDSLKINTNNKKLLNDILSELENWWEELPKSPLNILVNYWYKKPDETKERQSKTQDWANWDSSWLSAISRPHRLVAFVLNHQLPLQSLSAWVADVSITATYDDVD